MPRTASHVALLRGINVGGKNMLPMKALTALFADAGCAEVRTYIQSGNIVFRASDATARRVPTVVSAAIAKAFGYQVPVQTRTAAELATIVQRNPFVSQGAEVDRLHVAFLANAPTSQQVATLDPSRSPPDAFAVDGREIFLHLPNGAGQSKLTNAYFDSRLDTISTVRNWKTVLALVELARS